MQTNSRRAMREIEVEQRAVSRIYARLDALRAHYRHQLAKVRRQEATGSAQARAERDAFATHYEDTLARLDNVENRLVFGRLDLADDTRLYVGRMGISDEDRKPLLIDWRAPNARPFYQATAAHPGEVVRRRHITTRERTVVDLEDDLLNVAAAGPELAETLTGEGALLASLSQARDGRMTDIVATIQAEQDAIIRDQPDGILVVQGGPGTGKTAVALHRAAYLLYAHRERMEKRGVLLVGPSSIFLDYIDQVLPSLGETNVVATTMGSLLPGVRATEHDELDVADVKGSLFMSRLAERAVRGLQRVPEEDRVLTIEGTRLTLTRAQIAEAMERARRTGAPHNVARVSFVLPLLKQLTSAYAKARGMDEKEDYAFLYEDVRQARDVRVALNLAWMPTTPQGLLEKLYANRDVLAEYGEEFDERERELLYRGAGSEWTIEDIPMLDELAELLGEHEGAAARQERIAAERQARADVEFAAEAIEGQNLGGGIVSAEQLAARFADRGPRRTLAERARADRTWAYGHIVVDEAQELSPMAWRSLLRRCPQRSITAVGDLAQRSTAAPASSWRAIMGKAGREQVRQAALTVSYRTPATILDTAMRVLQAYAPGDYIPVTAARDAENSLADTPGPWRGILAEVVAAELRHMGPGRLAVITPHGLREEAFELLAPQLGGAMTNPSGSLLRSPLVVMDPTEVKGLEFDVVVLVEPSLIADDAAGDIYVAMTRPTRRLHAVHTGLPAGWYA
ncbi:DNA helicase IV [Bowdeniella nasicola]|uniref:DNA helicase IV n=1 Tax=Bowdeniella nasicola TaxID=208480 RepID=A0A1H4BB73_9ACTO|nr:AAA family ATPase [Bowdeniella nasicola]SEA45357.1 DNA helicase IV [Bowdeniella nasicola]